jgi:hypothetical protein
MAFPFPRPLLYHGIVRGLPLFLRVTGWAVSLAGAALLLASGGFGVDGRKPLAWAGVFVFLGGVTLTSSSMVVAQIQRMRALRRPPGRSDHFPMQ